ncbi:NUDIX hydrolase [Candidatus Gracilibacteria bacterium]|nr:NUDIX hydrolase [Candidatus Gracilibacteria bacterium]
MLANTILAADNIITRGSGANQEILLIKRGHDPFRDMWAFPAGKVDTDETIKHGALRELREETGIVLENVEFFGIYDNPTRDPRGRTVSVMYSAQVPDDISFQAADDAKECAWFPIHDLPPMAFDHEQVIKDFIEKNGQK